MHKLVIPKPHEGILILSSIELDKENETTDIIVGFVALSLFFCSTDIFRM